VTRACRPADHRGRRRRRDRDGVPLVAHHRAAGEPARQDPRRPGPRHHQARRGARAASARRSGRAPGRDHRPAHALDRRLAAAARRPRRRAPRSWPSPPAPPPRCSPSAATAPRRWWSRASRPSASPRHRHPRSHACAGELTVTDRGAVIGVGLAAKLGIDVGDRLRLQAVDGTSELFDVRGLFDLGNKAANDVWVLVSLRNAQTLLDLTGGVSSIELRVQDLVRRRGARGPAARTQRPGGRELDGRQRRAADRAALAGVLEQRDPGLCDPRCGDRHR
jgi:hypothetical protein